MIGEILASAWEQVTLGELLVGSGMLGAGAGSVALVRVIYRLAQATVRALDVWGRHLEASTAAAKATARLAPLHAEVLKMQILAADGKVPPGTDDDSDELHVLRVVAEGDERELSEVARMLAEREPDSTLPTTVGRAVRRLVELEREARRRREKRPDPDAPRSRERSSSWLRRRAARTTTT